jgi:hypothetical protein
MGVRFPIRLVLVGLALTAPSLPGRLSAQEPARPKTLCFNGSPLPACSTFLVTEMQGVLPVLSSTRSVRFDPHGPAQELDVFSERLLWELGLMHNVSDRWAVGGVVGLGSGSTDPLTSLAVRARRWLGPDLGLDLTAGATFRYPMSGGTGRTVGGMADARLNFDDDVYAGVRIDQVHVPPYANQTGYQDMGGNQYAASLMLGLGSEWAFAGSGVVALGFLWFLAQFQPS